MNAADLDGQGSHHAEQPFETTLPRHQRPAAENDLVAIIAIWNMRYDNATK